MREPVTSQDARRIKRMVDAGVGLLQGAGGSATGAAVGFMVGGPAGSAAGGAAGWLVSQGLGRLGREFSERTLAPREEARVGCVLALGVEQIQKRLEAGEQVRTDGFFESVMHDRSGADEVMENILLKSQREAEEKKLPYMANLFANIAFDSTISSEMAHQVIKAAEELTYRQLCLLRLAVIRDEFDLRKSDYRGQGPFGKELYQVLYECLGLYLRGYITFGGGAVLGLTDVKPASITVQGLGVDTYNLMGLRDIPPDEIVSIAMHLWSDG